MRLYGQSLQHFDAKGRIVVPRRFREAIGAEQLRQGLVVTAGLEDCLFVFPQELWDGALDEFQGVSFISETGRHFQREFLSVADDVMPDKLGRIRVSDHLRRYAGLGDEGLFVGVMNRLELWCPDRWSALRESHAGQYPQLAEAFHRYLEARKRD